MTLQERFNQHWTPEPYSGCYLWFGACGQPMPYGHFALDGKHKIPAHRQAWIFKHGSIPKGMFVLHHCDTPACVNPDHLFLGRHKENRADCVAKGRQALWHKLKNTKLNPEKVRIIRASKLTRRELAAQFGVHIATIQWAKEGRNWKHVK